MYRDRFTDITTQDAVPTRAGGRRIELLSAMRMQSFRLGLARVGQTLSRTLSAQGWVRRTFLQPAVRAVRATRLLLFPMHAWRLHDLNRRGRFLRDDPLMFLKREHYLSRFFGLRQRFDNVLLHYRHELDSFDETYRKRVYREDGLVLFEDQAGDMRVSMRLAASGEHRCEGEATVIAELNGEAACYVSYSFVDAACFGLPPGKTMFVTRSQLMPAVQLFRRCYPHSSPQYFCLAAIAGIALANRMDTIAVVKAEAQVCYQAVFDERFRNAYCSFWRQFDARSIDHQAYLLDVPLSVRPLDAVPSKHRIRAIERRKHWASITRQSEAAVRAHRVAPVAAPNRWVAGLLTACELTSVGLAMELL
jgi:uncharacterized protein VirK/YbjX